MAPITKTLALAGALFAVSGVAAPVKRAVVWETVTDIVWTTVDVTTTLYPNQPQATSTFVPVTTPIAEVHAPTTTTTTTMTTKPEETLLPKPETTTTEAPAAPAPTTTQQPEITTPAPAPVTVEPTTTAEAPASTAPAPAPASNNAASSSGGGGSGYSGVCSEESPCTGDITFYQVATSMTNPSFCGGYDTDESPVLALPVGIMTKAYCGKTVTIKRPGREAQTGRVVDKCMGCDDTSIDLSPGLFQSLANEAEGRVSGVTWYIN
ncbi:hypothetical protein N7468_003198 [Penicillium chermesinum]|uniref:Allergen Asp f 7 n=1 Tax=Penicillium chermesinum TaxID=63820 RepID=A0A9W9P5Z7_9EURO|nr:uncharacterized protein N7468_003198 [Penicillium chermesinum]KAJ5238579.1 hypothetical protein N7468_003198 [Penicillium chermesinum]